MVKTVSRFFKHQMIKISRVIINNLSPRFICKLEYKRQSFKGFNERAVEWSFLFKILSKYYPRTILDVGSGTTALPYMLSNCGSIVTAVDNIRGYWPTGMGNRHFYVISDNIVAPRIRDKFDLITCVSVLEHIEKSEQAMKNMFTLLNEGGHIVLTFPYSERTYSRNVYELPNSNASGKRVPYICQSYSRKELEKWLRENGGQIVEQEYWQFWEGNFWTEGDPIIPPKKVSSTEKHQLTCILIKKMSNG